MEIIYVSPQLSSLESNPSIKTDSEEDVDQVVSHANRCKSANARYLCLYNLDVKLKHSADYDIGGTYSVMGDPELWFLIKTTNTFGKNSLLNLYVISRSVSNFSIGISYVTDLACAKSISDDKLSFEDDLEFYTFKPTRKNELMYIKTFCHTGNNFTTFTNNLFLIPIEISSNVTSTINPDMVDLIKAKYNIGKQMFDMKNKDFILVSSSGREFPIHRIVLAAHSHSLREIAKDTSVISKQFDNINDGEMELLIEFLYNGCIDTFGNVNCSRLITIAKSLELRGMLYFMQKIVGGQITLENVIDIALVAELYKLEKLKKEAFTFIKFNSSVLQSEAWENLEDANLAKKLFEFVQLE